MRDNIKIPSPWAQLFLLIAVLLAMNVFAGVFYLIFTENHGVTAKGAPAGVSADFDKIMQAVFSLIVFALTAYIYARVTFRDRLGYQLGLRPAARGSFYLLGILLLVFALPAEGWLGELNRRIPLAHWMVQAEQESDKRVESYIQVRHSFDPIVNILVMAAIPAFCEELCFRGALQRIMIQICKRPLAGILLTAILFSSLHLQFAGFLPRVFLGVLLGFAYWYSGSLWVPILGHFVFNAAQIIGAMYFPDLISKLSSLPLLFVLLSFVIVVGLLAFMRSRSTATYAQAYET
jgi:membrane protease YdiL (CAAX protease family)